MFGFRRTGLVLVYLLVELEAFLEQRLFLADLAIDIQAEFE